MIKHRSGQVVCSGYQRTIVIKSFKTLVDPEELQFNFSFCSVLCLIQHQAQHFVTKGNSFRPGVTATYQFSK